MGFILIINANCCIKQQEECLKRGSF